MSFGTPDLSLNFVSASSPEDLVRACLSNNIKKGKMFNYFSVVYAQGKYTAFYHDKLSVDDLARKPTKAKK